MTRLLSKIPAPLRVAILTFAATLAALLGLACFATLSLAPLTSASLPAILARSTCVSVAFFVAVSVADATQHRGRK